MKRRASLFKDQRVRNPELEELVAIIDGSTIPTIGEKMLAFPMQLRKQASVKALEEVPREKKIKITLSSLPEIHAASCSTSKEQTTFKLVCKRTRTRIPHGQAHPHLL